MSVATHFSAAESCINPFFPKLRYLVTEWGRFIYFFIYVTEREGGVKEKDKQTPLSILSTESDTGFHLITLRSWSQPKSRIGDTTDCATHMPLSEADL